MSPPSALQGFLHRGIGPLLSPTRPQRRFLILHELFPGQESAWGSVLSLLEQSPSLDATLTFDDGFSSSYTAIRGLKHRKAIFFVCPEYINRADSNNWQDFFSNNLRRTEDPSAPDIANAVRPTSWEQLRELVALGHHIGSHSMSHARLSTLTSEKELEREIIGSAEMIEDRLGVSVDSFSHPFGNLQSISERALKIILRRYRYFFTGIRGNNDGSAHSSIVWRDTVHFYWPIDYTAFLLKGGFDWRYWLHRRSLIKMA